MTAKISSRTTLYQGKVYNLIRENVTLDNGVTTDVEFVEHPGATAIIPLLSPNRLILLKQYRHALREYIWEIPAGTLDPEESVIGSPSGSSLKKPAIRPPSGISWEPSRRCPDIRTSGFISFWPPT